MTTQNLRHVDPLSVTSLYLELMVGGHSLALATGFIVKWGNQSYLFTNWHVVSGRHPETNAVQSPTGAVPDQVRILHHGPRLGIWVPCLEPLLDAQGNPRWIEHPKGHQVDVIALPLQAIDAQVSIHPFDLSLADVDLYPVVAMPVSIIGFPLGLVSAGAFPIWKTGHIASDPDLDYRGQPAFLIDATTRSGMSGSPVVVRLTGGPAMIVVKRTPSTRFLGVYSGRVRSDSEIGIVWRPGVITDILGQTSEMDA